MIIGLIAGALTTFSFLPQAVRAIRSKHTKDLSLPMLLMLEIGVTIWLMYGILIKDIPLIAANGLSLIFVTITLIMKLKYK